MPIKIFFLSTGQQFTELKSLLSNLNVLVLDDMYEFQDMKLQGIQKLLSGAVCQCVLILFGNVALPPNIKVIVVFSEAQAFNGDILDIGLNSRIPIVTSHYEEIMTRLNQVIDGKNVSYYTYIAASLYEKMPQLLINNNNTMIINGNVNIHLSDSMG